jgi:type IV pilus biogenesis protein CpaD/CtpE
MRSVNIVVLVLMAAGLSGCAGDPNTAPARAKIPERWSAR